MYRKDYILRMIEQLIDVLHRIAGLKAASSYTEALDYIRDVYKRLVGLDAELVHHASTESLVKLLSFGGFDAGRCIVAAELLREEGEIYLVLGRDDERYARMLKSLELFLSVVAIDGPARVEDRLAAIDSVVAALAPYELPVEADLLLLNYYEKTNRFARAENVLFRLLGAPVAPPDIVAHGIAFYERLLQKTDGELQLGDLPRDEVEASLAELRERG